MPLHEGWIWLGCSLFGAIVWSIFYRILGRLNPQVTDNPPQFFQIALQFFRLVYYLGIPFAALLWGHDALVARPFGLQPFALPLGDRELYGPVIALNWRDWAGDVGWAVLLGALVCGVLGVAWLTSRRLPYTLWPIKGSDSSTLLLLREAVYHEVHWAFYRHMPVVTLGLYWGVWCGLGLVTLEAMLNPAWYSDLSDPSRAPERLMRASMAIVSTLLFLKTENLWLAVLLHWIVSRALVGLVRTFPGCRNDVHSATPL